MFPRQRPKKCAALLANMSSIPTDFVSRQKVGGTSFKPYLIRQVPILPPDFYTEPRLAFITPKVLELTYFRGAGFAAEMELGASGDFVVLAGSRARVDTAATIPRGTSALRKTLLDSGVLRQEEDSLVVTSDYSVSSASAAAAAICGSSVNGRNSWKLPDGRTYADWEADQGEAPDTPNSSMNSGSTWPDQRDRLSGYAHQFALIRSISAQPSAEAAQAAIELIEERGP